MENDRLNDALQRNDERVTQFRDAVYRAALAVPGVAVLLGVAEETVLDLVAAGQLFVLDGKDGPRLPAWQFTSDGALDGVGRIAAAFPRADPWAVRVDGRGERGSR